MAATVERNLSPCMKVCGKLSRLRVPIKSADEAIRFREDKCTWNFHLTYTAVVCTPKAKDRVTVEDPDAYESYVQGKDF